MPYMYDKGTFIILTTNSNILTATKFDKNNLLTLPYNEINKLAIKTVSTDDLRYSIYILIAVGLFVYGWSEADFHIPISIGE